MKLRMTLKDPDGVWDSLEDAGLDPNNLPEDVQQVMDKYVEFGEYVTIEFDLAEMKGRVVPN